MEPAQLFVYGTLMPGERLWPELAPFALSWAEASAPGRLWDTGHGYPGVRFDRHGAAVPGVVVRLGAARASEAVAVIDAIEAEGRLYRRVEVVTSAGCAFAYEWLGRTEGLEPLRDGWPRTGETRTVAAGARRSLSAVSIVETGRMRLRPWREDDLEALAAIFAEPAVWHHPLRRSLSTEESERFLHRQIAHWELHGFGMWAAEERAGNELVGYIGLSVPTFLPQVLPAVEVGWRLHPRWWGAGLATEGGRASLRHGFDVLGLDRIISIFEPENVASGRVMAKLGLHDWLVTEDPRLRSILHVREITAAQWRSGAPPGPADPRTPPVAATNNLR